LGWNSRGGIAFPLLAKTLYDGGGATGTQRRDKIGNWK
jgi:hypothetical protein